MCVNKDWVLPMSIPDFQSLMLPVLSVAANAANGEIRIGDVIDRLAEELALTPEERAHLLPSGTQGTFANRVHWAKFHLSKAGLIENTRRGYFKITPRGQQVIESKPARIDMNFLSQFEEFEKFRRGSDQETIEVQEPSARVFASQTPDEIMRAAHRQIEASLAQELLDRIHNAPPDFFERLILKLLLSMKFGGSGADAARALGRTGDDGVDGVINQDALGLDRIYVQAKRYAVGNNIGSGAIRDFFGSLDRHKAPKGLFVTTSSFSPAAIETAKSLTKHIVLIHGQQIAKLMIQHSVGCRVEDTLEIKKIDEDFFD
jgi:restriction system protein